MGGSELMSAREHQLGIGVVVGVVLLIAMAALGSPPATADLSLQAAGPGAIAGRPWTVQIDQDGVQSYRLAETWADRPRPSQAGLFVGTTDISSTADGTVVVLGKAFAADDRLGSGPEIDAVQALTAAGQPRWLLPLDEWFVSPLRIDGGPGTGFAVLGSLAEPASSWGVVEYASDGSAVRSFSLVPGGRPVDLAVAVDGRVYVTKVGLPGAPDRIEVYSPEGHPVDQIVPTGMGIAGPDDPFVYFLGKLDTDPDGAIYALAVAERECPPGPPGPQPPPRRPTATATPRPDGDEPAVELAQALPCQKSIVLVFEPDHRFRLEVPNEHRVDIAAGSSGVFVTSGQAFHRPAQRVYELYTQQPVFSLPAPAALDVPLPISASEMQLDVTVDGVVLGCTDAGDPFYRGPVRFEDPAQPRPSGWRPKALGIYERPVLAGPTFPRRVDGAKELVVLEAPYQRYGPAGVTSTAVDVLHDAEAVQRWTLQGMPFSQFAYHDKLLRDGAAGSDRYHVVMPLVDIAFDGRDLYLLSEQVVWHRPDGLAPRWQLYVPGAHFVAAAADEGRLAVLNEASRRVMVLSRDGRLLYDRAIARDAANRLASDIALRGDRVYLADYGRNSILVRSLSGADLGEWPTHDGPQRISAGRDGEVYVLGRGGWGLVYAADGALRAAWRLPTQHRGIPVQAEDIAVGYDGRVYVSFVGLVDPPLDAEPPERRRGYDITAGGIWVFEPYVAPGPQVPAPEQRACLAEARKNARPQVLLLGEKVQVTLDVDGYCPGRYEPQQLFIVLDTSWSMHDLYYPDGSTPGALRRAQRILSAFLSAVEPGSLEVGLVTFSQGAAVEVPLTSDLGLVRSRIVTRRADGGTVLGAGIQLAHRHLVGPKGKRAWRQTILFVSDGLFYDDPAPAVAAARADGIQVAGLILSTPRFDEPARERVRSVLGEEWMFVDPIPETIGGLVERVSSYVPNPGLFDWVTIEDLLPANMSYVTDSASPVAEFDAVAHKLRWQLTSVSAQDGVRLTYWLKPQQPSHWPTNLEARADYVDALGSVGRLVFPVPRVLVLAPEPLATPTVPTATPTATPTSTVTSSPTVQPSATRTPKDRPWYRIYLPMASRAPTCVRKPVPVDVVLTLDMSTSMYRLTRQGRTKHQAALGAARDFISFLRLASDMPGGGDQVAVVGFNDRAWTACELTSERRVADQAIAGLVHQIREGTRLDLALAESRRVVLSPQRRPGNEPVVILLSDGLPNRVPTSPPQGTQEEVVLRQGERLKAAGAAVYTIGLGEPNDVWHWLLETMATDRTHYYYAPDAEDLAAIYDTLLVRLVCDGG